MPLYLARVALTPTPEMAEHGQAEAAFVAEQTNGGRIRAIYATPDKSVTWHLIEAVDAPAAEDFIGTYPFAPWFSIDSVDEVVVLA